MALQLTLSNYRAFGNTPQSFELKPGVTAFVGPNNAGKSSLFRLLFNLRPLFASFLKGEQIFTDWQISPTLIGSSNDAPSSVSTGPSAEFRSWACRFSDHRLQFQVTDENGTGFCYQFDARTGSGIAFAPVDAFKTEEPFQQPSGVWASRVVQNSGSADPAISQRSPTVYRQAVSQWYAKLRPLFEILANVVYIPSGRHSYSTPPALADYFDYLSGVALFEQWHNHLSGIDPDNWKKAQSLQQRLRIIFDDDSLSVQRAVEGETLQVSYGDERYRLAELGGGFGQFLTIAINLLLKNPSFILVDEPENGLHPRLQTALLELLEESASIGVAFSTHSLGLARTCAESIFAVVRNEQGASTIHPFAGKTTLPQFLGEMSFSAYQDLGFSKLLFVEGKSDVPVFRHWLRLLGKDQEVLILPLAGSSGIPPEPDELQEAKRICPNISMMIDSERHAAEAALAQTHLDTQRACSEANVDLCILERRATENYYPHKIVKALFPAASDIGKYGATDVWKQEFSYRKVKHGPTIAAQMTRADLDSCDLGKFLKSL